MSWRLCRFWLETVVLGVSPYILSVLGPHIPSYQVCNFYTASHGLSRQNAPFAYGRHDMPIWLASIEMIYRFSGSS